MTRADPILGALARWRAADDAFRDAHRRARAKWPGDPVRAEEVANRAAWPARDRALRTVYATAPTTLPGLAALAALFEAEELAVLEGDEAGRGLVTILHGIARIAAQARAAEGKGDETQLWLHRRIRAAFPGAAASPR
jgi:hypothetical protein